MFHELNTGLSTHHTHRDKKVSIDLHTPMTKRQSKREKQEQLDKFKEILPSLHHKKTLRGRNAAQATLFAFLSEL